MNANDELESPVLLWTTLPWLDLAMDFHFRGFDHDALKRLAMNQDMAAAYDETVFDDCTPYLASDEIDRRRAQCN